MPDHRGAGQTARIEVAAYVDALLDDVHDLLDSEGDAAVSLGMDHHRDRLPAVLGMGAEVGAETDEGDDAVAVLHDLSPADVLDAVEREFLEAGHHVQGDRHLPALADADYEHPLDDRRRKVVRAVVVGVGASCSLGALVGAAGQRRDVEDERYAPVTEDRGAGVDADRLQPRTQALDDDLLGVEDAVDDETELPVVGLLVARKSSRQRLWAEAGRFELPMGLRPKPH